MQVAEMSRGCTNIRPWLCTIVLWTSCSFQMVLRGKCFAVSPHVGWLRLEWDKINDLGKGTIGVLHESEQRLPTKLSPAVLAELQWCDCGKLQIAVRERTCKWSHDWRGWVTVRTSNPGNFEWSLNNQFSPPAFLDAPCGLPWRLPSRPKTMWLWGVCHVPGSHSYPSPVPFTLATLCSVIPDHLCHLLAPAADETCPASLLGRAGTGSILHKKGNRKRRKKRVEPQAAFEPLCIQMPQMQNAPGWGCSLLCALKKKKKPAFGSPPPFLEVQSQSQTSPAAGLGTPCQQQEQVDGEGQLRCGGQDGRGPKEHRWCER